MRWEKTVTVVGELNLDVICTLPSTRFRDLSSNRMVYTPLIRRIGGTGGNFAVAARNIFRSVRLVGCVGADSVGSMLEDELSTAGIQAALLRTPEVASRMVLLIAETPGELGPGTRLTVTTDESPSYHLTQEFVANSKSLFQKTDLLYLSAYSLLREPSRAACLSAMRTSREGQAAVALDIVPHEIRGVYSLADMTSFSRHATILIAELGTFRQLLDLPASQRCLELADALETMGAIRQAFPDRWLLVRFGVGNADQSLVVSPQGDTKHAFTGYQRVSDTAGFGDKLTTLELGHILHQGLEGWPDEWKVDTHGRI